MAFRTRFRKVSYLVRRITRRIWFRAFTYALVGIATAFVGLVAKGWVPNEWASGVAADAVGNILSILASSMLAVATFSLSTMVTAFGNVSTGATPRAARLLMENQTAQRAVSTFIGGFLYSVVGIIALTIHAYGDAGRFVLFVVTILVIVFIVATLIRWLDQLSRLGRVGHTIAEVERATLGVLEDRARSPFFGARVGLTEFGKDHPIYSDEVGILTFVDFVALQDLCRTGDLVIHLAVLPGDFAYPGRPLAYCDANPGYVLAKKLSACFVIETARTFDHDPRLGFVLLAEIAGKALSKAVNDPGTAIEVLSSGTRILAKWSTWRSAHENDAAAVEYDRILVPALDTAKMLGDLFCPVARDGAGSFEVVVKLVRSLKALEAVDPDLFGGACTFLIRFAGEHAERELKSQHEKSLVRRAASSERP